MTWHNITSDVQKSHKVSSSNLINETRRLIVMAWQQFQFMQIAAEYWLAEGKLYPHNLTMYN